MGKKERKKERKKARKKETQKMEKQTTSILNQKERKRNK